MIDKGQLLSLVDHAIMGKTPNRSSPAWQTIVVLLLFFNSHMSIVS